MSLAKLPRNWVLHDPEFLSDEINPALSVSPWVGHRGFAYDWMAFMRPSRIVELGTHFGCSFFAFAQAARDLDLETELVAVDTWEGDGHTGPYNEQVFDIVSRTVAEHFSTLRIRLLRSTFLDARAQIEDRSVSLLHIDGFHTYEAVKEDFKTWLPKLAENAVVFFHDVAPSSRYGSADFWAEIRKTYRHVEFLDHSFGLGVLFPRGDAWYRAFEAAGCTDWIAYYRFKADARLYARKSADKSVMIKERDALIKKLENWVKDRDEAIAKIEAMVDERNALIHKLEDWVKDRDEAIAKIEAMVAERDALIHKLEDWVKDRDETIAKIEAMVDERDALVHKLEDWVKDRGEAIAKIEAMVGERDALIHKLEDWIKDRDAAFARPDKRDALIKDLEMRISKEPVK